MTKHDKRNLAEKKIIDKFNELLKKHPPRTRTKHEQIFFDKIKKYNESKEYHAHYVKVDNDVMVIEFNHKWEFRMYPLEELK